MSFLLAVAPRPAAHVVPTPGAPVSGLRRVAVAIAALVGVLAALFVATPPASATVPARTALESSIAWAVKSLIVTERAASGRGYVYMSSQLQLSARRHDVTMAAYNTMSHQLPGEPSFGTRENQAGYYWNYAGENIAWNSAMSLSGALTLEKMMFNEVAPNNAHRLNILNSHFRDVGVDVYMDWTHRKLWLTVDFGHRS
ncbi:MAG: CAP domain-containing protein [Jatrophihabitans sp.]|uniref:CAP domain-containing protein n=1 Tax=Jatrophihabitans sp. TaxID=1932789 RepID=UPI00390D66A6